MNKHTKGGTNYGKWVTNKSWKPIGCGDHSKDCPGVQPSVQLYSLHEPNIMKPRTSAEGAYSQGLSSAGNYSTAIWRYIKLNDLHSLPNPQNFNEIEIALALFMRLHEKHTLFWMTYPQLYHLMFHQL